MFTLRLAENWRYLFLVLCSASLCSCAVVGTGVQPVRESVSPGVKLFPAAAKYQDGSKGAKAMVASACTFSSKSQKLPSKALLSTTIRDVASRSKDAVVNIYVKTSTPIAAHVLGVPLPAVPAVNIPGRALGSGFICSKEGFVLSNAHVVKGASQLFAKFASGKVLELEIIAADEEADLSLLKIRQAGNYPFLRLAEAKRLEPGDWVIAIGNPLGLNHTVSHGIVSQSLVTDKSSLPGFDDDIIKAASGFLLSDTPLNPGNSGGPLIDLSGSAVGVNTAIVRRSQGISLSVPAERVRKFLREAGAEG